MIPGFITAYKDKEQWVHLYFYPGVSEQGRPIYMDVDISDVMIRYSIQKHIDNSVDYKFYNKSIVKIYCKLITSDYNVVKETLIV